jgi:hypothetical protein
MEEFFVECQINLNTGPNFDRDLYLDIFSEETYGYVINNFNIEPEVPGEFMVTFHSFKDNIQRILFEISELDPEFGTLDFFTELELDNAYFESPDNNL